MSNQFFQIKHLALVSSIFVLLMFFGCGMDENIIGPEATTTPGAYTSVEEVMSIIKAHEGNIAGETQSSGILLAPKSEGKKEKKIKNRNGGTIWLKVSGVDDAVRFKVAKKSLKMDTNISMELFREVKGNDLKSLNFEFGPSGTQFDPVAKLGIPFELLIIDDVDTFVVTVESSGEVEGVSYDIDYNKEMLIAYIPHFSNYYFAR